MKALKPAIVLGIAGVLTVGSMTASQARVRPWVAGAAGFAAGAAIGTAAAASANGYYGDGYYGDGYYGGGYYNTAYYGGGPYYGSGPYYGGAYAAAPRYRSYDPTFANTADPNSARYGYYNRYAYAPGYRTYGRSYGNGYYDASTQSAPRHYDPGYGYNSNTLSPWQDRKMQGLDY